MPDESPSDIYMVDVVLIPILLALIPGIPLAIYSGVIVARYYAFDSALGRARTLVLNLEQSWEHAYLPERIPDTNSPTGRRGVYMSRALASNDAMWQMLQVGLELKEQGHWGAATEVDRVAFEVDALRQETLEKAQFAVGEFSVSVTAHIADWHRRLSRQAPRTWLMLKPWPNSRYEHLSCISVNEATGEWRDEDPPPPRSRA